MLTLKLATSNLRVHKIRVALTVAAIALSVSLVVSVTSGYASVYAAAHRMLAQYMGSTDAIITRHNDLRGGISSDILQQLINDPLVERVDGRLELEGNLLKSDETPVSGRVQLIGIHRPDDVRVEALRMEEGVWFDRSDSNDAVIDQVAARELGAKIGDSFIIPSIDRKESFKVVGIVHKPGILAGMVRTVYLPVNTLQKLMVPDRPDTLSRVMVDLVPGADAAAFSTRWTEKMAAIDPNLMMRLSSENRQEMDKSLEGLRALSFLGGTVSMVAATFIVFSALSMGVAERQRSLAMLRAIGAYRSQLGKLVVCEGIVLACAGMLVGVPLGILWINILAWKFSHLFSAGVTLSYEGILFATIGSILTALAASLLPAVSAMRASPLDAMTQVATPSRFRNIIFAAIIGLLLAAVDPFIVFGPIGRDASFYGHFIVGLPAAMLGFFLLGPLVVWGLEWTLGPLVALIFGIRYKLFRQQLSSGIWRAAGTCAALMVGLSILIVTQTQGVSAIQSWKLPDRFPDIFIYSGSGISAADEKKLASVEGIKPNELMPIAVASPQLGSGFFAIAALATFPNATMYFGIDPDKAFKMMDLDFREGNAEQAQQMLKLGRHVVVTQEFQQLKGIHVGDKLPMKTGKGTLDFTVAGVVWSPAMDVFVSSFDLARQFDQRTAASVFGTVDDAREYFGVSRINFYAANLDLSVEKQELLSRIQKQLGGWGLQAGDVRQIKHSIQQTLARLLMLVSTVAYAALAVASLGVTNTIMASIRTRRWHFGILRSIGVTRSQLLRLVLAEATLLGLVGTVLGLGAGLELAIDAHQAWDRFFGFKPDMVIPWDTVALGGAVVMLISLLASLWPAIHVAHAEPLSLLQAGRATA